LTEKVLSLKKREVVDALLQGRNGSPSDAGHAFAPVNIALCKYWGKRDSELNLPINSSLSISLDRLGAETTVTPIDSPRDRFFLNDLEVDLEDDAGRRVADYLDLLRPSPAARYRVDSHSDVPVAAGIASSASGFAALALALNDLFGWGLERRELSILARLGSGSAARSVYDGFVEWHAGQRADGMDCFAERIDAEWKDLRIALVEISDSPKPIGSRPAMARTVETSRLYSGWPRRADEDIGEIRAAISGRDIERLGAAAESNALAMHATMLDSRPPILYWKPATLAAIEKVWHLRDDGSAVYLTMDAGPNLKLVFEKTTRPQVEAAFPGARIVAPF